MNKIGRRDWPPLHQHVTNTRTGRERVQAPIDIPHMDAIPLLFTSRHLPLLLYTLPHPRSSPSVQVKLLLTSFSLYHARRLHDAGRGRSITSTHCSLRLSLCPLLASGNFSCINVAKRSGSCTMTEYELNSLWGTGTCLYSTDDKPAVDATAAQRDCNRGAIEKAVDVYV